MTVSMQVSKRIYAGNGVTRRWDVDFPLASPQDVRVYVTSPAGTEKELSADFELNIAGTELVYPTLASGKPPLAEGWSLTLERHTPLTQEIDLIRQGEVDAEVLESGYDKLTLLVQELNEKVSRSIKYPVSTSAENLETDSFLANILTIKQTALDASGLAAQSAQSAQSALAEIAASGLAAEQTLQTYLTAAQEEAATARYYAERSVGKTVGEVYYSQSPAEADNPGALPLFTGETISSANTLYPDFYAWLQAHPALTCSSAAYETALAQYGECPKYVLSAGSLRLPLLKNQVKMADSTSGVTQNKANGGLSGVPDYSAGYTLASGTTLTQDALVTCTGNPGGFGSIDLQVNGKTVYQGGVSESTSRPRAGSVYAAKGSVISSEQGGTLTAYPLKPVASGLGYTTLYPWVFAYHTAVAPSVAQAGEFLASLTGKADADLSNLPAYIDYVVDSYKDASGNWYRKYKSGWLEQGGVTAPHLQTVTLNKPFANNKYVVFANIITGVSNGSENDYAYSRQLNIGTKSVTMFQFQSTSGASRQWAAFGQGA